jgi:UDP-N-acetylmuramate--alanine ligase
VFADCADVLMLLDIYPAREEPIEGVSSKLILQAAQDAGLKEGYEVSDERNLVKMLSNIVRPGDVLLTIGAGTITTAAPPILEQLSQEAHAQFADAPV